MVINMKQERYLTHQFNEYRSYLILLNESLRKVEKNISDELYYGLINPIFDLYPTKEILDAFQLLLIYLENTNEIINIKLNAIKKHVEEIVENVLNFSIESLFIDIELDNFNIIINLSNCLINENFSALKDEENIEKVFLKFKNNQAELLASISNELIYIKSKTNFADNDTNKYLKSLFVELRKQVDLIYKFINFLLQNKFSNFI